MAITFSYVKRFAAGAVFGIYIAYLLYFLNPQLNIDPGTILTAAGVYAAICGLLFGTLLWLLRWLRVRLFGRGTAAQYGFGNIVAAATISATTFWVHLELFRIYLPRGAVRVLSKATILLFCTAFVLFILWLFERTSSKRNSRTIFIAGTIVVLTSAFLLYERRDGYRDTSKEVVYAEVRPDVADRPVIVVAIRSLPYDWIIDGVGEGILPHFEHAMASSFATRVEPFRTTSPKALWASLATGQLPYRHGVTGRYSYRTALSRNGESYSLLPTGIGFRAWGLIPPVKRLSAQLPAGDSLALWSCYEKMGLPSHVVNWPGTFPARSTISTIVSDRAVRVAVSAGSISPASATQLAAVGPPLIPPQVAGRMDLLRGRQRSQLSASIVSDVRAVEIAKKLRAAQPAPLTVIALNSLGDIVDITGGSRNSLPARGGAAGEAVRGGLILIDRLIADLRASDPTALLVIVSPTAPQPPPLPLGVVSISETLHDISDPGANNGLLLIDGADVTYRPNPRPIEVVDVVPTILYAASLPLARDLDGDVITEAFDESLLRKKGVTYIASYRAEHFFVRH